MRNIQVVIFDIILGINLPVIIAIVLLSPILFTAGVPFYGDELYYSKLYLPGFFSSWMDALYSWVEGNGPNNFLTLPQYTFPLMLFEMFFEQPVAVKLLLILMACLPYISTYISILVILKLAHNKNNSSIIRPVNNRIVACVGGLIMMLSFTNYGLTQYGSSMVWPYSMTPLFFAFFLKFINSGQLRDAVVAALTSILASTQPIWLYLFLIMTSTYLFIELFSRDKILLIKRTGLVIVLIFLLNSFWVVPILAAYLLGTGGFYAHYTTGNLISFDSLRFLSFWNIFDVIMNGERSYYFFWPHPQNYTAFNAIIPILATASILIFHKNKYVLSMALTLIIGIFFTKGVWEPAGYIYYFIASHLPYGGGAILRNPTKFVTLVTFSYAFLIGFFVLKFSEKLSSLNLKKKIFLYRSWKIIFTVVLILLILSTITYGTLLDLQNYTWIRYKPTYVPAVYNEINSWIANQEGDFKVMWIPSGGGYIWKPYIITAFPDFLSSRPAVNFQKIYPAPLNSTTNMGEILKMLGVKYVIYHGDSLDYPNDIILSELKKQNDLKQILMFNYTYYTENNSNAPLPIGKSIENIPLEFANIPFKLLDNNYILSRGAGTNLKLYYEIPSYIVSQGFSGTFSIGFSMRIWVFPAGSTDINSRIYEAFVSQQILINNTAGYVIFNVKIPENYPYTAVDVYVNIYDGSFRPLSPLYYIGRFTINPAYVTIPFIVFENEAYEGQTYIESGNATIISYSYVNPVETEVVVNASTPFTLVFTEPYDKLWRAYVNGKEIEPRTLYGMVNEFLINEKGILHIKIYYTLQIYFNLGWLITALSFIILIILFIKQLYINKLKLIHKKVTKF